MLGTRRIPDWPVALVRSEPDGVARIVLPRGEHAQRPSSEMACGRRRFRASVVGEAEMLLRRSRSWFSSSEAKFAVDEPMVLVVASQSGWRWC